MKVFEMMTKLGGMPANADVVFDTTVARSSTYNVDVSAEDESKWVVFFRHPDVRYDDLTELVKITAKE